MRRGRERQKPGCGGRIFHRQYVTRSTGTLAARLSSGRPFLLSALFLQFVGMMWVSRGQSLYRQPHGTRLKDRQRRRQHHHLLDLGRVSLCLNRDSFTATMCGTSEAECATAARMRDGTDGGQRV